MMSDQKDDATGPAGEVAPVEEVAAEIGRMFDEAAAKGRRSEPGGPPAEPVAVRLMTEAWGRAIEVRDVDARLFPEHRGLEPGQGSGRA